MADIFEYTSGGAELSAVGVMSSSGISAVVALAANSKPDPDSLPLSLVFVGTSATGSTWEVTSANDPDGIILIFRKDAVPYSAIEKRADEVYRQFHSNKSIQKYPCVIVESPEIAEELDEVFAKSPEQKRDFLTALQKAYREYIHG